MRSFRFLILFSIALFAGCVTGIMNKDIQSIEVKRASPAQKEALGFSRRYEYYVSVRTRDGTLITDPDYTSFVFSSPNGSCAGARGGIWGQSLSMRTGDFSFAILEKKFQLKIEVNGNPFSGVVFTWDIDTSFPIVVDRRGDSGAAGGDGGYVEGKNRASSSSPGELKGTFPIFGEDGGNGRNGDRGMNGTDLNIDVAFFDAPDGRRILIYDTISRKAYIGGITTVTIDASGGSGGCGGTGGKGESNSRDATIDLGGNGGDGGDGADGGNAGTVTINYPRGSSVLEFLNVIQKGGEGGCGGTAGAGGEGRAKNGRDGKYGRAGRSGVPGTVNYVPLENFSVLFSGIDDPAFKRDKLVWDEE